MGNFNMVLLLLITMAIVLVIAVVYNVRATQKAVEEILKPHLEKEPLYMVRDLTSEPMIFEVTKQYYEDQVRFAIETGMIFVVHQKSGNFIVDLIGE